MFRIGRRAVILSMAFGGALALPQGVAAHALLQSSDPAAGSTVASAPSVVTLTFGEAPDPTLSSVKVLDASGKSVASGPAVAVPGQSGKLKVPLGLLRDGVYTVAWRTVSVVDGHTAAGSFGFGVGVAPSATGPGEAGGMTSPSGSPAGSLGRFVLYLGLIGLFGAGFIGAAVHPRPPRSIIALAAVAWLLSAVGTLAVVATQVTDAGADLGTFMNSALGAGVASRLLVVAGSGIVVGIAVTRRRPIRRWLYALTAAAGAGGMLVDVLNGHAAAGGLTTLQIAAQWVHIVAAGAWMGGLAALLLSLRGLPSDQKAGAVLRFSRWAGVALAAVAATGLLRALQEVRTIDALVGTDFGRLVIAKSGLLGILALLGAINHFISVPAAVRTLGPLRRVGRVEVSIGVLVLLASGVLVNLAPPSSVAANPTQPPERPVVTVGNDFGTTVRVRLVVTPGSAGLNEFALGVTDYDTGTPISADDVTLRFSTASTSGVGGSSLALTPTGPGSFAASGGNLSLDGIWKLTAVVAAPSGSVEVPLAVATRIPSLHVEANPVAGAPTIFTAHLPAGNSLQVYLDPGRPGPNELHATFFDASGHELPVPSATVLLEPAGGPNAVVAARQLEPGHFVADLDDTTAGSLGVDVIGAAPGGATLHAHFDIPVQS